MTSKTTDFIQSCSVKLALQDYGGAGPLLLLLHGAGRSSADWRPMAPLLTSDWHVIALDLRGHGLSEPGDWTVDHVLADIKTVLQRYSASEPAIAGHSLGGVLAFLYAHRYGGVSHVIDLDGFALRASGYIGLSEAEAVASEERARAGWVKPQPNLTGEAVANLEKKCAEDYGLSIIESADIVGRLLKPLGDDSYSLRLDMRAIQGIQALYAEFLNGCNFFDVVRATENPSLIFRADRLDLPPKAPKWYKEMLQAYRLGVREETNALQHLSQFTLSVRDTSHAMMLEEPRQLAAVINHFLQAG